MKPLNRLFQLLFFAAVWFNGNCRAQELSASDTAEVRFLNSRKFYLYKVGKSETIYGISKKFNIPQDELLEFNPEVKDGLKVRMTLWVPAYSWSKKDKKESAEPPATDLKRKGEEQLHVVILSSLDLAKVYTGEADSTDSAAVYEPISRQIQNNLHFVEGATLAIERFHASHPGFKVRTTIIDCENDTIQLSKISWKFRTADVWITNESGAVLEYLNRLSVKNEIQLVSCGVNTAEAIRKNSNAISILPGSLLQCERMGVFASRKFKGATGLFVKTSSSRENERMKSFKAGWSTDNSGPIRTIDVSKSGVSGIVDSLVKGKKQVIFIPSSNEDMVTNLLIALKDVHENYDFSLVGLPTWFNFETVDPALLQKCNTYYFNSGSVDFSADDVIRFRQSFRDKLATEPAEPAYLAYDAVSLVMDGRSRKGKDFIKEKGKTDYKGLFTEYSFDSVTENGSSENQAIVVWTFHDLVPERVHE